jgi:hypothetical protein
MNRGGFGVWCSESVRHGGLLGLLNFALCFVSMDEAKLFSIMFRKYGRSKTF